MAESMYTISSNVYSGCFFAGVSTVVIFYFDEHSDNLELMSLCTKIPHLNFHVLFTLQRLIISVILILFLNTIGIH